jgi:hypothetical protein
MNELWNDSKGKTHAGATRTESAIIIHHTHATVP